MNLLAAVVILLSAPLAAAATADAPHGHAGPTGEQWKLLAFTVVNFAIFVYVMYRLARVPVQDFLAGRRRQIVAAMAEATRLKEEAAHLKLEFESKAAQLDQARADLIKEIRAIAEAERVRALAEATEAAERMRRDAERTAKSDLERAKEELRAEAARLVQKMAADEVRRRLTDQDRGRLLAEFLARVSK